MILELAGEIKVRAREGADLTKIPHALAAHFEALGLETVELTDRHLRFVTNQSNLRGPVNFLRYISSGSVYVENRAHGPVVRYEISVEQLFWLLGLVCLGFLVMAAINQGFRSSPHGFTFIPLVLFAAFGLRAATERSIRHIMVSVVDALPGLDC